MDNRKLRAFHFLLAILAFSVPDTVTQTTDGGEVTEIITAEATTQWDAAITEDPCAFNPCNETVNSECVADGESYSCICLKGYTLNDGVCSAIETFSSSMEITIMGDIEAVYTEALADVSSPEFRAMATSVEDTIDTVYRASSLASNYLGCHVNSFSSGSLLVDYSVSFAQEEPSENEETPAPMNTTAITNIFVTTLAEQVTAGNIEMTVDVTSIVVEDYDECLSANDNYCHDNATCTNIPGSFSCACDEGFLDVSPGLPSNPGRACDVLVNEACLSNPCTDPTMVCVPSKTSTTEYSCDCKPGYNTNSYWSCSPIKRAENFRCYTCHDSYDINECNGRTKTENGSLEWCPNPTDTCFTTIQMNPEGDGWMIRKGCMNKEDCYDILYGYVDDPEKESCYTNIWPYGPNTGPKGGLQCHYCCNERWGLDMCNKGSTSVLYTVPFVNNWDPRMKWDLTLDWEPPTEESGAARLAAIGPLGILVSLALAYILH